MSFTQEQLRAIYAMAMGYGTEAGRNPYSLNLVTGPNAGNSGYSVGVIQVDFGAQGEKVATNFLGLIKSWAIDTKQTVIIGGKPQQFLDFQDSDIVKRLVSNRDKGCVLSLDEADKAIVNAWLAEPGNQSIFFSTFENPIISLNLSGAGTKYPGISSILGDSRFNALSQVEQTRILVMLDKTANQGSVYGSLQTALNTIKALPDDAFNADRIRGELEKKLSYLAIDKADNVGQVLSKVMSSDRLK